MVRTVLRTRCAAGSSLACPDWRVCFDIALPMNKRTMPGRNELPSKPMTGPRIPATIKITPSAARIRDIPFMRSLNHHGLVSTTRSLQAARANRTAA